VEQVKKYLTLLVVLVLATSLGACATGGSANGEDVANTSDAGGKTSSNSGNSNGNDAPSGGIINTPIVNIDGPKRTVAVGKFGAVGGFTQKYGSWDIGGGMSAMMTTALIESDRFIVMERANIGQVLSEQEMKGSGVVNPETGPKLGNVTGVQYLIYGSVTEFGTENEGGGVGLGFSGGGLGSLLGGALSHQSTSGSVGMDIRIVDTSTSQVMKSITVKEEITSSGFDVSLGYKGINLGTNRFWKTPLGEATRKAINKAVQKIAVEAKNKPWVGRVVDVSDKEIYINAGSESGVNNGQEFVVKRVTKTFTDPETGVVLGSRKKSLGMLKLLEVEPKMAYGNFSPLGVDAPKRGDLVLIANP